METTQRGLTRIAGKEETASEEYSPSYRAKESSIATPEKKESRKKEKLAETIEVLFRKHQGRRPGQFLSGVAVLAPSEGNGGGGRDARKRWEPALALRQTNACSRLEERPAARLESWRSTVSTADAEGATDATSATGKERARKRGDSPDSTRGILTKIDVGRLYMAARQ